jgi:hypothetical protein
VKPNNPGGLSFSPLMPSLLREGMHFMQPGYSKSVFPVFWEIQTGRDQDNLPIPFEKHKCKFEKSYLSYLSPKKCAFIL